MTDDERAYNTVENSSAKSIKTTRNIAMKANDRYAQAKRITIYGGITNACLGVLKIIGGILYNSHALIADGLHSFSDLS